MSNINERNGADSDDLRDTPYEENNPDASGTPVSDRSADVPAAENGESDNEPKEHASESSAMRAFRSLTSETDDVVDNQTHVTLPSILGGDILGGRWFFRQFWFIIMVVVMLIFYVSNRYACQHEMIETKVLTDTLMDRRYKALTRSSQLKEKTRRSRIEESLVDTTIRTAVTPSFNLVVEE